MLTTADMADLARDLITVPGVRAVALGGSRARGTHHAGSDVDLGLYYQRGQLDVDRLGATAARWEDSGGADITPPGAWGPWVDGGSWLTVRGTAVDLVLRDIDRVQEQCDRARRGEFAFHPQPGHPLGFLDVAYAGEVANGVVLQDPEGLLGGLKACLQPYPVALREAMVANLWQADSLVQAARKGIPKLDVAYVELCCSQALMLCAHAWHAAAGRWPTNEKGLVVDVATLPLETYGFAERASRALCCPEANGAGLTKVVGQTAALVDATRTTMSA